jgi:hypothetical protein
MLVRARLRGCWCWCGVEGPHSLMSGAKGTATVTACHLEFLERRKGMSRGQQQFEDPSFWGEGEGKPWEKRSSIINQRCEPINEFVT